MKSRGIPRLQLGNGCYLYGDFAPSGTYGHLDPVFENTHGMTQSQVSDFIRSSRPDLFKELGGLPFSSTDVQGFSLLVPKPSYLSSSKTSAMPRPIKTRRGDSFDLDQTVKLTSLPYHTLEGVLRMLESQHKRHIQLRVLNGDQLILQKLTDSQVMMGCSDPGCAKFGARVSAGSFFLTLARKYPSSAHEGTKSEEAHYNLACLEAIFDRGVTSTEPCEFDGQSDGAIDNPITFPFHFPSNSPEALKLRKRRHAEIEEILHDEHAHKLKSLTAEQKGDVADNSPNLKLTRATNVLPYDQRYKKQGLQYTRRQSLVSDEMARDASTLSRQSRIPVTHREDLICICREPGNDEETITCTSEACMIGTFHVRCLNLEQPIGEGDEIYCMYCAEDSHQSDTGESNVARGHASMLVGEAGDVHQYEPEAAPFPSSTIGGDYEENSSEARIWSTEEEVEEDPSSLVQHSFTVINGPNAGTYVSYAAEFDGPHSPVPATPYLKPISASSPEYRNKRQRNWHGVPLPPGSSSMTFTDLAPFITISSRAQTLGWTEEEVNAFKQWKNACPKSRLLAGLSVKPKVKKGLSPIVAKDVIRLNEFRDSYSAFPFKLSELLKSVSAKSA